MSASSTRPARFAGVLFDKDGTLIDFERTWGPAIDALIHFFAAGDPSLVKAQAKALHFVIADKRFLATSPIIAGSTAEYGRCWSELLGRTDIEALVLEIDALSAIEAIKSLTPIGEPLDVFTETSGNGTERLGIATNDSEEAARRQIDALGASGLIEFVAGYDFGYGGKPAPGMILAFARFLRAEPAEIVMVGDSQHDLLCARAAGATSVAVLSGPAERAALAPHADFVVDHIGDLPSLLADLLGF